MFGNASTSGVVYVALYGKEVTAVYIGINLVIFLLGFLALSTNALVIDTLVRRRDMEAADIVVCHLAGTDMLTGVLVIYTVHYNLVNFQSQTECIIRFGFMFTFVTCSVLQLALLTVDRLVKIVFTYRYQAWLTNRNVSIVATVIWFTSINIGLLPAYGWRNTPEAKDPQCAFLSILSAGYIRFGMCFVYTPFAAICIMYFKIFLVARKHAQAIAALEMENSRETTKSMKFTKTVLILTGAYFISFTPFVLTTAMYTLGGFGSRSAGDVGVYLVYTSVLVYCNSVVNPVIYAFKLPLVKRRLLRFLRRRKRELPEQSSTVNSNVQTEL